MSQSQAASSLEYRVGDQPVPGYTLVRELGRGAMGVVWLARTESGFERALKVINLQQRGGKKEYRGLRTIKQRKLLHGNLLTLIDYWLKDRDGKFIPDRDELDDSDSFFAPKPGASDQRPWATGASTPQSRVTTDAGGAHAATRVAGAEPPPSEAPPTSHRAATLVPRVTMAGDLGNKTNTGGEDQTVDVGEGQRTHVGRPVQLIVAMELGHKTLDDRQKQCHEDRLPGIPPDELLAYMEQAARGLDYLHREGIVHRDIKPGNIMLVGDVAKVCDYGLVVTTDADLRATSNAFTPLYASPEAVSEKPVTGQSDQYSLAVTYIELRTGRTPYKSETAATVFSAKETGKYDLSRIRKSRVRNILKRALAHAPTDRFGSCSQFIRDLDKAEHSGGGALWALTGLAALLLIAIGGALAVPDVRERLLALAHKLPDTGGDVVLTPPTDVTPSVEIETQDAKMQEAKQPATPELPKIVEEARALRLAGNYDDAAAKLDELKIDAGSKVAAHWPYQLERLHLEISRQSGAPSAVPSSQWEVWKQDADRLWQRTRGQGAKQAELAALQLMIATHLDPARMSLQESLADELARAAARNGQWGNVFSQAEQETLQSLFDRAAEQVVASRDRLPDAWKSRFTAIWPPAKAVDLLTFRVRQCIKDENAVGLSNAAADLNEIAAQAEVEAAPALKAQLADVRLEAKEAQSRLRSQLLAKNLTNDEFLASAAARKALADEIQALGDISEMPLASLLRIEIELAEQDARDQKYTPESLDDLRAVIGRLSAANDSTSQELLRYARFLLARAEIHAERGGRAAAHAEQLEVLLSWPEAAAADWHTPRRKEQAIEALLRMADAGLTISSERPYELSRELIAQAPAAATYLEKAQRLGGDSPDLAGLLAVAQSALARQAEPGTTDAWRKVAESANRAVADWASVTDKHRRDRLPAVQYVAALAASKLQDPTAVHRNRQAIVTLASLVKQTFSDAAAKNPTIDRSILENIVVPGLKVPLTGGEAPRQDLAALHGAKGRIIERNPSPVFLAIPGIDPVEQLDEYAKAMLTAHAAYSQALKLYDDVVYASGAARTLLKLPREVFDWSKYEAELSQLVKGRGQAAATDASLLFADACVLRRRAFLAPQRSDKLRLAEQAIDRFAKVDAMTRAADPYEVRGVALCAASDTHLKAGFWTPIGASDEAKTGSGDTKYFHLQEALKAASSAKSDANLLLPEEASTAKGNALEDLAYYYKETDNYPRSAGAFQEAIEQIGRRRSKAYALMSLGRCKYRWAMDAVAIDGNPDERLKRLRESFQSLTDAVAHARSSEPTVAPEASYWLATVKWESALDGPGDLSLPAAEENRGFRNSSLAVLKRGLDDPSRKAEATKELTDRLNQLEQARQDILQAAQQARSHSAAEWANYLPTAAFLGKKLAEELGKVQSHVSINVKPTALWSDVRQQAEDLLAATERQPGLLGVRERRSLVDLLVSVEIQSDPTGQKTARLLQEHERLFREDNDDARAQLVMLRLMRARLTGASNFRDAEQLAERIADPSSANWARGFCDKFKADALLRPYSARLTKYLSDPTTSTALKPDDDAKLQAIQDAYTAALERLSKAADPKTIDNLRRLCAAPLGEVETGKWHASLTNLEAQSLRLNIEETELIRKQLYELLEARIYLHRDEWKLKDLTKPLPPNGRAALRLAIDCLKPIRFIELRFSDVKLDDYLRDFIRACEAKVAR